MRRMTEEEIERFVASNSFAILSLADEGAAYGVPLFYGSDGYAVYFQTRGGLKTPYLARTREACLTITQARGHGEWASVQLVGSIEPVDVAARGSQSRQALLQIPPPFAWWDEDAPGPDAAVTTYRLAPARLIGRYSMPAEGSEADRSLGFEGM